MLDQSQLDHLRDVLCDRFSPDELLELLGLTTEQVFDAFTDECLELNLEEVL